MAVPIFAERFIAVCAGTLRATCTLLLLSSCTALGLSVTGVGGAVVGAGAGAAVKAGTEYELGGGVARTFTVPLSELRPAAVVTFERLDIERRHESDKEEDGGLVGCAHNRTIRMKFEAITDVLTRVRVTVSKSFLTKDLATAEEIVAQLKATVDGTAASVRHPGSRGDRHRHQAGEALDGGSSCRR